MADYTPVFVPGDAITLTASAAITGGQMVEVSGNGTVGPAGAASVKAIGVAAFDAASGAKVTVHIGAIVHEVTASGAITAGDGVKAAAAGQVSTVGTLVVGQQVGIALTTAANGAKCRYVAVTA